MFVCVRLGQTLGHGVTVLIRFLFATIILRITRVLNHFVHRPFCQSGEACDPHLQILHLDTLVKIFRIMLLA